TIRQMQEAAALRYGLDLLG
ncbi:MAG: hypothetical protein KDD47_28135, partial [Acidobacteria bacterium]|nr:hypothetical protein [Acidobacteriota bacterium]